MILQIRTKDDLNQLLANGKSPAWVISQERVPNIEAVEIYQFDGSRVLKGTFDRNNSQRLSNGRLVVAFTNGSIEDASLRWNGQNPIKYKTNNSAQQEEEALDEIPCSVPTIELLAIDAAYEKKSDALAATLKESIDKHGFTYAGFLLSASYEDLFEEINNIKDEVFTDDSKMTNELAAILNSADDPAIKWHEALKALCANIESQKGVVCSTIAPNGGTDFAFLLFSNPKLMRPLFILYHFNEACNSGKGWFDEYFESFNISYEEYLSKNKIDTNSDNTKLYVEVKDGMFGKEINSNSRALNLTEELYQCAILGMQAAKEYC